MIQFTPGKLYRLPKTEWCQNFDGAFLIRTTGTGHCYLSSDTVMFIHRKNSCNIFSQGNNIFIFYHSYVERTLQLIA